MSYRDKNTLYRYYDEGDLKKAQLIKFFGSLNFSISEIKKTLEIIKNETDLTYIIEENSHFGGHAVVLFGYDNETEQF